MNRLNSDEAMNDVRVLALIGGEGDEARRITEALRTLDPACATVATVEEVAAVFPDVDPHVVIVDAGAVGLSAQDLSSALSDLTDTELPPILVLHDSAMPGSSPDASDPHYLYRPFASQTLAALAMHLALGGPEHAGVGSEDESLRPTDILKPNPLYEKARDYAEGILASAREGEPPDIPGSREIAEQIHTDLLRSNALVRKVLEPHASFDLASHSVNVAIIAGKISLGLADPPNEVVSTIQAGLVHDIGMARIPEALIGKMGTLTEDELAEVRRHPEYGCEILEPFGSSLEWLARVILQEHERANGQGYPLGLPAASIDPLAKIVAVADVFEALSHPRTYRSPHTTFDALEQVVGMQDEYFASHVVSALVNEISSFPPDSYVQLSTGEICQVVSTNHENLMRPRVRVIWDADWGRLERTHNVDLASNPAITVTRSLLEAELPIT